MYTVHYDKNENIGPYDSSMVFLMINHLVSAVESGPLRPLQSQQHLAIFHALFVSHKSAPFLVAYSNRESREDTPVEDIARIWRVK